MSLLVLVLRARERRLVVFVSTWCPDAWERECYWVCEYFDLRVVGKQSHRVQDLPCGCLVLFTQCLASAWRRACQLTRASVLGSVIV